jgi:hypothetical protein
MPALSSLRQKAIEAIGAALTEEDIEKLVMEATGNDIYNIYAAKGDPRATLISKTLTQLENEGHERWLLTFILIANAQEKLRMLIVNTWPGTLVDLPEADGAVTHALEYLRELLNIPLPIDLRNELRPKHDAFDEIRRRIAELYGYKSLHELLHLLHLKLVVAGSTDGGAGPDFSGILAQCDEIAAQAPAAAAQLESNQIEFGWIAQLAGFAASLKSAVAASDTAACLRFRDVIQTLTRLHLSRLNMQVFKAAKELSFEALVEDVPFDIETQQAFTDLVDAVRDIKPTVIARALKQSLWQEAENGIADVANAINVSGDEFSEFSQHWTAVKSRVLWLAKLDPDDPWAKQAKQFSDEIDDGLSKEKLDDDIKHCFETYRNLFRFRFLAIDNTLKKDCSSLCRIDAPLTAILKELTP